jgi:hypothetical protein
MAPVRWLSFACADTSLSECGCADTVLPATLVPLNRLLADTNANVVKRAILTASTLFGHAFVTM